MEPNPTVRLPLVIPDEWLAAELEPKRINYEREFRQGRDIVRSSQTSACTRSLDRKRGDYRLSSRPLIDAEDAIVAPPAEFQHVVVVAASAVIEVRVGSGDRPLDALVIIVTTERVQRGRVKANWHPRFGVGDDLIG